MKMNLSSVHKVKLRYSISRMSSNHQQNVIWQKRMKIATVTFRIHYQENSIILGEVLISHWPTRAW